MPQRRLQTGRVAQCEGLLRGEGLTPLQIDTTYLREWTFSAHWV